jgi:hypothetical protein
LSLLHGVCTAAGFKFNSDVSTDCFILAISRCVAVTFIFVVVGVIVVVSVGSCNIAIKFTVRMYVQ